MTAVSDILSDAPDLPTQVTATIETEISPVTRKLSTSAKLRRRTQRLLTRHAPVQADEAATERRRDYTDVTVEAHWEPGLSTLTAVMTTLQAAKLMTAINTHAKALHEATTTTTPANQAA